MVGKKNLVAGFLFLGLIMIYGFVLVYMHDFAPDREAWIATYGDGEHFMARLLHAHGGLFALINIVMGYLLMRLPFAPGSARGISWLALAGLLMPIGIWANMLFGLPPLLVLVGSASILAAVVWFTVALARLDVSRISS